MTDNKKRVAVLVGAGMVSKTHVAACAAAREKIVLKGIASRNNESAMVLADAAAKQIDHQVITYDSIAQIADDTEVDFVIIATPPNVRAEIIRPLVKAGKHILLEKPVGRNSEEASELVTLCQESEVILGIVFQYRARAASIKATEMINSGQFGELGMAEFNVPWWREQSYYDEPGRGSYERDGGGVLINQAIHTIDLGLSLTGPVRSVIAMAKTTKFHKMESEDYVVAGLEFASGAVGSLTASTASFPGRPDSIILHYEHATLRLEAGQLHVCWRDGRIDIFGDETSTGGGADPMAFTHEWHQHIMENFTDALNGEAILYASGEQALAAHNLIDATTRSAKSGTIQLLPL